MSFDLPILLEQATEAELLLASQGVCAKCAVARPPPFEGRPGRTLELKYTGGGYRWYQCRGCRRVWTLDVSPAPPPSRVCPRCSAVTYNTTDIAQGYCGACHAWT